MIIMMMMDDDASSSSSSSSRAILAISGHLLAFLYILLLLFLSLRAKVVTFHQIHTIMWLQYVRFLYWIFIMWCVIFF